METRLTVLRKRRTDWIITWQQNKLRWVLFYYLVGLILSCLLMFFLEVYHPLENRYLSKTLMVLVVIPCATVLLSIAMTPNEHRTALSDATAERDRTPQEGLLERHEQPLLALLMVAIWAAGYFAIAYATEAQATRTLPTFRWEQELPLTPEFVFIYLTIYPTFLLPFLFIRQKEFFRLFSFAYITVMCICYLVYLFFPVSIERPTLSVTSFSTWVLAIVYRADRPWNCFPSMHVAMSLLAALTILEVHRIRGMLNLVLTLWIAYSTILIKQHYVLDVVTALALTFAIHFVYVRRRMLNALFENILRAEETLERWINRKIDSRVWESLNGPLRPRVLDMVQSLMHESVQGKEEEEDQLPLFSEADEEGSLKEQNR